MEGGRFVVFDVETPNFKNDRMSSIGVVVVEKGRVTERFCSLINPEESFSPFNIRLTGITPELVADKPTFPRLWDKLRDIMEGAVLVAHNAPFDMGVLGKCLEYYKIPWHRSVSYACTVRMGRKAFPQLENHRLNTISDYLGIELDHHDAMSDAAACAQILLHCMENGLNVKAFIKNYDLIMRKTLG